MPAKPKAPAKPALTRVRLDLSPEEHGFLRVAAAKANLSMAMLARKLVQDYMKQEPKSPTP